MTKHDRSRPPNQATDHPAGRLPAEGKSRVTKSAMNKPLGAILVAVLLAGYAWAQPLLNAQLGWNLPAVTQLTASSPAANTDSTPAAVTTPTAQAPSVEATSESASEKPQVEKPQAEAAAPPAPGAAAAQPPVPRAQAVQPSAEPPVAAPPSPSADLKYGLLQPQGNERYLSPAGLLYVRGSAEGHRLKHLERHTEDDPDRPGSHGVFDGGMEGALVTIDKAYRKAKTGVQTTKEEEDRRVIYTVDLGTRVGFVGGQSGQRRRNPMARRVRLVLEDNRVITAFPL